MEKRTDNQREIATQKSNGTGNSSGSSSRNHSKKNKRRGSKKGNHNNNGNGWNGIAQSGSGNGNSVGSGGSAGGEFQQHSNSRKNFLPAGTGPPQADYTNIFWQQSAIHQQQQLLASPNGQRLFTAVSDPSVCGYSPMPLTYAMEPVSLPPMYQLYQQVPRPSYNRNFRGRPRRNHAQIPGLATHLGRKTTMTAANTSFQNSQTINGYSSLQENHFNYSTSVANQNGDYASLPPAPNIENGAAAEEVNSEHRRYSDPGLGPPQIPVMHPSEDSDSIESGSSVTTVGRSSKLILGLIEQVTALKESNSQLFKELHQTKCDLENVKLELNGLKQSNFADYQPGMLSDIVREMREAAKVREESLISKVKSMMNERQVKPIVDTSDITELDELKSQLSRITDEKTETETRLAKVEHELATLKSNANHEGQEIVALEEETLALRRELQEARASRTQAENHAAKCVNAVARSVTPATPVTPVIFTISTPCCSMKDIPPTPEPQIHGKTEKKVESLIPISASNLSAKKAGDTATNPSKSSKITEKNNFIEFPTTSSPKIGCVEKFGTDDLNLIFDHFLNGTKNVDKITDLSPISPNETPAVSGPGNVSNSTARFQKNMKNFEETSRNKSKLRKNLIPDVAVVSGKSVALPKKPSSVKILNSKGLKPPPKKSTYTTAYI